MSEWTKEITRRINLENDERHAGGVYDMSISIAKQVENVIGHEFDDIDAVVEVIYNAVKYGIGEE